MAFDPISTASSIYDAFSSTVMDNTLAKIYAENHLTQLMTGDVVSSGGEIVAKDVANVSITESASAVGWKSVLPQVGMKLGALGAGVAVAGSALSIAYQVQYDDPSLVNGLKRDLELFKSDATDVGEALKDFITQMDNDITNSVLNGRTNANQTAISADLSNDLLSKAWYLRKWSRSGVIALNMPSYTMIDTTSAETLCNSIRDCLARQGLCSSNSTFTIDSTTYNRIKDCKYISLFAMINKKSGKFMYLITGTDVKLDREVVTLLKPSTTSQFFTAFKLDMYSNGTLVEPSINPTTRAYNYNYRDGDSNYSSVYSLGDTITSAITHSSSATSFAYYDKDNNMISNAEWGTRSTYVAGDDCIGSVSAGLDSDNYLVMPIILNNGIDFLVKFSDAVNNAIDNNNKLGNLRTGSGTNPKQNGSIVISGEGLNALDEADNEDKDIADVLPFLGGALVVEDPTNPDVYTPVYPSDPTKTLPDISNDIDDNNKDNFPETNPAIPPYVPSSSGTATGFTTMYHVSDQNLNDLSAFLWANILSLDGLVKLFSNPIDCIISLIDYPMSISDGQVQGIKLGNTATGVSAPIVPDRIQDYDLGSVNMSEYFNNFLDYSPYTKVSIYLPFIGIANLSPEDVVNSIISVRYRLELVTGSCLAIIHIKNSVIDCDMYQYSGLAGMQLPITGSNNSNIYKGIIGAAAGIGATIASGGSLAPVAIAAGASAVAGAKTSYQRAGSMQGNASILGGLRPYIIIERPITNIPSRYKDIIGTVANRWSQIGNLTGYNVFENFDVSTVDCTDDEKAEITSLLSAGIFI